jgi:hypothetical protein
MLFDFMYSFVVLICKKKQKQKQKQKLPQQAQQGKM